MVDSPILPSGQGSQKSYPVHTSTPKSQGGDPPIDISKELKKHPTAIGAPQRSNSELDNKLINQSTPREGWNY